MFNGAPHRCTISSQTHRPRCSDVATSQILPGLGPGGPVIYASDSVGPGAKERLVQRLLTSLPGQETDYASRPLTLETTALGQPRPDA